MELNRAQRAAARHKKTEAVDCVLEQQEDVPVHSYSDSNKTLYRSGVVVRNDKNVGHDAMQRARELLDGVSSDIGITTSGLQRPVVGTNDNWFKKHQLSVEQQIGERINVHKTPQVHREESPAFEHMPVEHYQPQIADDAEEYIPMSER